MKNSRSGFSILELSVVLTVVSLIIGSALAIAATRIQAARIEDTETKTEAILDMLDSFVSVYGYLPCPADPQALLTATNFGDGSVNASTGACTATNLVGSGNYRIGVVPTKTLKMVPAVMMDGWNRRISYAVDTRFTTATNYSTNTSAIVDPAGYGTVLEIDSALGTIVTQKAVVVIISYGADGHGAWKAKGGATTVAADPVPTDADALANVNNDNVFVQKVRTSTFDDLVFYRMRWQLPPRDLTQ